MKLKLTARSLKQFVRDALTEAETEKQRRWACAQLSDDFKGERKLDVDQAEEICRSEPKKKVAEGEGHDCDEAHPEVSHSKWAKGERS